MNTTHNWTCKLKWFWSKRREKRSRGKRWKQKKKMEKKLTLFFPLTVHLLTSLDRHVSFWNTGRVTECNLVWHSCVKSVIFSELWSRHSRKELYRWAINTSTQARSNMNHIWLQKHFRWISEPLLRLQFRYMLSNTVKKSTPQICCSCQKYRWIFGVFWWRDFSGSNQIKWRRHGFYDPDFFFAFNCISLADGGCSVAMEMTQLSSSKLWPRGDRWPFPGLHLDHVKTTISMTTDQPPTADGIIYIYIRVCVCVS